MKSSLWLATVSCCAGKGTQLSPVRSLFEKPEPERSTGRATWLRLLQSRRTMASHYSSDSRFGCKRGNCCARRASSSERLPLVPGADTSLAKCRPGDGRRRIRHTSPRSGFGDSAASRYSSTTFAWSSDSDRVVLTNWRSGSDVECHLLEAGENRVKELQDRSAQLNRMKIAAIAFSPDRSRIAAVSSERKVMLIGREDLQVISKALNGQDWIQLPEGFQPNGVAFGPGDDELTLTSWTSIRILNTRNGKPKPILPPTFRDQFMRIVFGPGDSATRLVAISFYGRVQVAKNARWQESAEPVVFRASMGVPQFSPDGKRLLILSGGVWNVFDNMRLIDVSQLYRPQEAAPENFEGKPAPPWLAEIASAVSALDVGGDGSLTTLEAVRKKYPKSKAGDPYESVWKRFFPDERSK